jgi:hypothetical protein
VQLPKLRWVLLSDRPEILGDFYSPKKPDTTTTAEGDDASHNKEVDIIGTKRSSQGEFKDTIKQDIVSDLSVFTYSQANSFHDTIAIECGDNRQNRRRATKQLIALSGVYSWLLKNLSGGKLSVLCIKSLIDGVKNQSGMKRMKVQTASCNIVRQDLATSQVNFFSSGVLSSPTESLSRFIFQ